MTTNAIDLLNKFYADMTIALMSATVEDLDDRDAIEPDIAPDPEWADLAIDERNAWLEVERREREADEADYERQRDWDRSHHWG